MINNFARYSVVLKTLLDNEHGRNAINNALSNYPLYIPKKFVTLIPTREQLNMKLLNHYKYREIGFETVGRFLDELEIAMNEIMPYYNERFKTVEIMAGIDDPFGNVDVTETFEEQQTSTNTQKSESEQTEQGSNTDTGNTTSKRKFSDTPQNNVTNINNFLTEYTEETVNDSREGTNNSNTTSVNDINGTTTGQITRTHTKKGNQGVNTYAHDMIEFRDTIIDVVNEIINDKRIAELFMLVY